MREVTLTAQARSGTHSSSLTVVTRRSVLNHALGWHPAPAACARCFICRRSSMPLKLSQLSISAVHTIHTLRYTVEVCNLIRHMINARLQHAALNLLAGPRALTSVVPLSCAHVTLLNLPGHPLAFPRLQMLVRPPPPGRSVSHAFPTVELLPQVHLPQACTLLQLPLPRLFQTV